MAHSRSFLANQNARNAIVGAENLLKVFNRIVNEWNVLRHGITESNSIAT